MKLFLSLLLILTQAIWASEITNISLNKEAGKARLNILTNKAFKGYPSMTVDKGKINLFLPDLNSVKAYDFTKVVLGTETKARVYSEKWSKGTKVIIDLGYDVSKRESQISMTLLDRSIQLAFPIFNAPLPKTAVPSKAVAAVRHDEVIKKQAAPKKMVPDYEKELLKEIEAEQINEKPKDSAKPMAVNDLRSETETPKQESDFSLTGYILKFVAFVSLMLVGFYGIMTLFKKGMVKKGKLGFLEKTDQLQIINQTYLGPKRSLALVKTNNQVFLIGATEQNINLISEVEGATGLIKNAEREAAGNNFDDNVEVSESMDEVQLDSKVKIKKDITKSNQSSALSDYLNVKDKIKFSDQLKKKAKSLKPLQ